MQMSAQVVERRMLEHEDIVHMALPRHFWNVRFSEITSQLDGDEGSLADKLGAYLRDWQENRRNGLGLIISGLNGTGKTCAAVVVGQEFRRRGQSVLFVSAADVRDLKFDGTWFSEDVTYWEWIREVDVLILDDLGKGDDTSGYNQVMWDQLLRHRHDHRYVTIITTNLAISGRETKRGVGLDTALKKSTMEVLKESMLPLRINGKNRRDAAVVALRKKYDA